MLLHPCSALRDRRFQPIDASELPQLTCTVSLLHSFEGNKAWDAWEPGRHGIIISFVDPRDGRRKSATFLPEVAREEGWGRRETLEHLVSKAGCATEGPAFDNLLPKISLTRYQSTAASLSYDECVAGCACVLVDGSKRARECFGLGSALRRRLV